MTSVYNILYNYLLYSCMKKVTYNHIKIYNETTDKTGK